MAISDWPGIAWLTERKLQNERRHAAVQFRTAQLQRAAVMQRRFAKGVAESVAPGPLLDDDSQPYFDLISYQTKDGIDEPSFRELQRRCYKLYVQDPLIHAAVETMVNHIVGDRFQMRSLDHDPRTQEEWDKQADNMAGNRDGITPLPFPTYAQNVVRQFIPFGEDFQREYINPIDGSCHYRCLEPLWIYNPGATWPFPVRDFTPNMIAMFGIMTDPHDLQRIVQYYYDFWRNGQMTPIPAAGVIHTKNGDTNMKRGRPVILPAVKPLIQLNKVLQARSDMHLLRTVVAYWDTIPEGTDPEIAQQIKDDLKIVDGKSNDGREVANEHGSTALLNGLERHYATPNLEAADAYNDIKAHVFPIARALGLNFSTFWGDTSGETDASARENGFTEVLGFTTWQHWFGLNHFERVGARSIKAKINAGTLSAMSYRIEKKVSPNGMDVSESKITCERNTKFECEFPELRIRDIAALTNALLAQYLHGIIDKREFRIQIGVNADSMDERVALEKLENPDEQGMAAELAAAMGGGSEKGNAIKTSNNNGGRGGNGHSDSKALYRHQGTKS